MKYRAVYRNQILIECTQDNSDTVTSSTAEFLIDTIENIVERLTAWGIDISLLWSPAYQLISRLEPNELLTPLINISDKPNSSLKRKVFIYNLSANYTKKEIRIMVVVKHYDNETYAPGLQDDVMTTLTVNNSKQIEGVGEWDYFTGAINQGANLFDLQTQNILRLDAAGRFNNLYQ